MVRRVITRKTLVIVGLLLTVSGCAAPGGPVFEPLANPPRWPHPPAPTRIEYVGTLKRDRDLKPGRSLGQSISNLLFGKKQDEVLVTPHAITSDGGTRFFVADSGRGVVHVFDLDTRRYEQWSPGATAKAGGFEQPIGVAWRPEATSPNTSNGHARLYVADAIASTIFVFDADGNPLDGAPRGVGSEHLNRPCGVAFDADLDRLYVTDAAAHQLIVLDADGNLIERIGARGSRPGEFNFPTDVAVDRRGAVYVSDSLNARVQVFERAQPGGGLRFIRQVGARGNTPGHFSQPRGLALDSDGHLYVIDAHFENLQVFDNAGRLLLVLGAEGTGPGEFWLPKGMHIDSEDRIWIADAYNHRVQVLQYRSIDHSTPSEHHMTTASRDLSTDD